MQTLMMIDFRSGCQNAVGQCHHNSSFWDYSHPDDQTTQTTPGFKPFTILTIKPFTVTTNNDSTSPDNINVHENWTHFDNFQKYENYR